MCDTGRQRQQDLVALADGFDLWHDDANCGYATVGRTTHAVQSRAFRHLLTSHHRKCYGSRSIPREAMSAALAAIEAKAVHDGPQDVPHVRIAGHAEAVYLHLADPAGRVVEIDARGWRLCADPPVRFVVRSGMLRLPEPVSGGSLDDLRQLLNLSDGAYALVLGWLAGCLRPYGPFPLLLLYGPQGSAKTTAARLLKALIDPSKAPMRSQPRDERDLSIMARGNWVMAFDNLSGLPGWLSDALCRLATGGGFSTRALFTDDEETIFDAKRPAVLNGVTEFAERADLLERAVLLRLLTIAEVERRTEAAVWAEFDRLHPRLLGALLDRVSGGLRMLPQVRLAEMPRMADFAAFAVACERGAGEPARFLPCYLRTQSEGAEQALDADPLTEAVLALMADRRVWEGTPTEALNELNRLTPAPRPKDWPAQPNALTNRLRRLAPPLRKVCGLVVDCDERASGGRSNSKRTRRVRISRVEDDKAA